MTDSTPPTIVCAWCGAEREVAPRGRRPRYCNRKCQVAALHYRQAEDRRGGRTPCPTCHGVGTVLTEEADHG